MGGMWVYENGVCAWISVVSPNVDCPGPYDMHVSQESGTDPYLTCTLSDGVHHAAPGAGDEPHGVPEDIMEPPPSPDAACPEGYTVEMLPVNNYAWRHRQSLRCVKIYKFQGRVWCPDGWTPYGLEYTELVVNSTDSGGAGGHGGENNKGDEGDATHDGGDEHHDGGGHRRLGGGGGHDDPHGGGDGVPWWEEYSWLLESDAFLASVPDYLIPSLGGPSGCAQAIAVDHQSCDEFSCMTPYTKEQESILRAWIVQKLGFLDEDMFVFESIPTGNDLKFTAGSGDRSQGHH